MAHGTFAERAHRRAGPARHVQEFIPQVARPGVASVGLVSGEPLQRYLERPGATGLAVALGVLLCAPSLGNGLNLDDVLQAVRLGGAGDPWRLFDLFGGPAPMVPDDDLPWWRHEQMRLSLMRPLASLSHIVDFRLFAGRPGWMHLHSLLWYALLLVVAARVYGRLVTARWAGTLALLLYAVDHSHGMVVGWLAARGGLIGAAAALVCLGAHLRWRRAQWRPGAALAPVALLGALLANEGAVGICGYIAAHALFLETGSWTRRLAALLPAALTVLAWRTYYVAAGFGSAHTGFYVDPGADLPGDLLRALTNGVILVGSQVLVSLGEALGLAPGLYLPGALIMAAVLAALGLWFRGELRRSPQLRFWAVGTLLCALPLGSTLPTDRQLLLIGFGVFGCAAQLVVELAGAPARGRGVRWFGRGWFVLHLILSPLLLPLRSLAPAQIHRLADTATAAYIPAQPPPQVVLLRVPSDLLMFYGRAQWQLRGQPFPDQLRYLYAGLGAVEVKRIDERTLELRPALGWLHAPLDRLYRDEHAAFAVGQQVKARGMLVEVVEVASDGRPLAARIHFDDPLADLGVAWYSWEAGGPAAYVLPAVGETHILPAIANPLLSP